MNFDLRLPVGMMFSLFGALLAVFGLASDKQMYETHSLGININLVWGIVLLVFGVFMLVLALRRKAVASEPPAGRPNFDQTGPGKR